MKGDFSRDTFDATKHFSRVLMQQGRVQLDADWNEQTSILLHYLRTLAKDILGSAAAVGNGFEITFESNQIKIGAGRMYVDGILCENDNKELFFTGQKNFPGAEMPTDLEEGSQYLVYLDVWERHITALEDDSIREKALGGADTATRAEVVWQVKIDETTNKTHDDEPIICTNSLEYLNENKSNKGKLSVKLSELQDNNQPCSLSPESKYRGLENHLYRVEIHKGSNTQSPTFKWSRDNGSVVTGCTIQGSTIEVDNPNGFSIGDCVEVTSDYRELRGDLGALSSIKSIDGNKFILADGVSLPDLEKKVNEEKEYQIKVRRWDMNLSDDCKLGEKIVVNKDIILEHEISVNFSGGDYTAGDYWLIPARVTTGIEWPNNKNGEPLSFPPHGVTHHYAPLAILTWNGKTWILDQDNSHCRKTIKPTLNA